MSDQWKDDDGIVHVRYLMRVHTICWRDITGAIGRDETRPPTCLRCVAYYERSYQHKFDLEKQGRVSS